MSRAASAFRQADIEKALKATLAAGIAVGRIEIDASGKIVIIARDEALKTGALDARGVIANRLAANG